MFSQETYQLDSLHIIVPAYKETPETLRRCNESLRLLYPESTITFAIDTPEKRRGKGRAIRENLKPEVINVYLDADLAVHPYNLTLMLGILKDSGGLVIARRVALNRSRSRTLLSKSYNGLARAMFHTGVADHQCGFKLLSPQATEVARTVRANGFFYDTELIVRCKKAGLSVIEYPVAWTEHKNKSTVNCAKDSAKMFLSLLKLKIRPQ